MKALGIDSSGMTATVAVVDEDNLLAEYTVNYKKTHSQTLLPMIDEIVKMTDIDLTGIDIIAISAGPGSFTGLRIGSATAKGLGLALKKPIVSVPTMEGLAYNLCCSDRIICPMMDARREQVFAGIYSFEDQKINAICDQVAEPVRDVIARVNELGKEVLLLGDGVQCYQKIIEDEIKVPYSFAPAHLNRPHASAIAVLGIRYAKEGKLQSAREHEPDYLRVSQAERERAQRLFADGGSL